MSVGSYYNAVAEGKTTWYNVAAGKKKDAEGKTTWYNAAAGRK